MNAYLLYREHEWNNQDEYYDTFSIIQDLGLHTLFSASSKPLIIENGKVKAVERKDAFLEATMRKVMMVPLKNEADIVYRQRVLQDSLANEEFVGALYEVTSDMLNQWTRLGRKVTDRSLKQDSVANLITEIHVLKLFVVTLKKIKELFAHYQQELHSDGYLCLYERLQQECSEELLANIERVLQDVSFFADVQENAEENKKKVNRPKIVLSCGIGNGLKLGDFQLDTLQTESKKYRNVNSTLGKIMEYKKNFIPDAVLLQNRAELKEQVSLLEFQMVSYAIRACRPFMQCFSGFFDQLHFELAFYRGAINLNQHMLRYVMDLCYPVVGRQENLSFDELKEIVMCMEQRLDAVGNTCDITNKMLLIVTGANQGGKSTFLRSIGIAQVMMQAGLMVAAKRYESGLFPNFFTHFTRREDSAMNSGRLDEELGRMNQIIEHLGKASLLLLNESFATTTEKEGSLIAYDIIRALKEAGVKILTVTHLLSFAQRVYDEAQAGEEGVEFFSAQRIENGRRTFKMLLHEPELTSFGLDLYEDMVRTSVLE